MKQVSLRYPAEKIEPRAARLLPHLAHDHPAMPISRARVLLMAMLEGLEVLERRYGLATEEA